MPIKEKSLSLSRNSALRTFGQLIVFSTKENLLYLLYSTTQRCCLLHLMLSSVTSMLVKKVKINLDSSKVSGTDCIPVVVLKNSEPELSYILVELFWKSCFPDCWKVWSVVPVHLFFYNQPVYKQLALGRQIAKQLSWFNPPSLSNNENYRLKKS